MLIRVWYKWMLLAAAFSLSLPLSAHEFWLSPHRYAVNTDQQIIADIRVGQNMQGDTYAYFPQEFERFDVRIAGKTRPLSNRFAQTPAVGEDTNVDGLHILIHQSTTSKITYESAEKFASFLRNEGISWVLQEHKKRDLPAADFTEVYQRFAKSLVKVGNGQGNDSATGMVFEWVLQDNPYTNTKHTIRGQLLFQGKPFANSQASVFHKRNGKVVQTNYQTDKNGMVDILVKGGGEFLVNAVHMIEPNREQSGFSGAVWMSLWASITFAVLPTGE